MGIYGINPRINFYVNIFKKNLKISNEIEKHRFNYQSFIWKGIKFYFYLFIFNYLEVIYLQIFSMSSMAR